MQKKTPLTEQYELLKAQAPDRILFFRMGDFYELFGEDAEVGAPIMGVQLTQRNKKAGDTTAMCGVPYHSVHASINKILKAGLKVAICDQVEDPKLAKGLVRREITRLYSPGIVCDEEDLFSSRGHFVASIVKGRGDSVEVSVGDYSTSIGYTRDGLNPDELLDLLIKQDAKEIVVLEEDYEFAKSLVTGKMSVLVEVLKSFEPQSLITPGVSARADGVDRADFNQGSSGLTQKILMRYLENSLGWQPNIVFQDKETSGEMELSHACLSSLEVFESQSSQEKQALFDLMDLSMTPLGSRKLRCWFERPSLDLGVIGLRHQWIGRFFQDVVLLQNLRTHLKGLGDLERKFTKVIKVGSHPRDARAFLDALQSTLSLRALLPDFFEAHAFAELAPKASQWGAMLTEEPPQILKQGGYIARGVDPDLDQWIALAEDSQKVLEDFELSERAKTGIASLRIKQGGAFGLCIEVPSGQASKVPDRYIRKQTLSNFERYTNKELAELEAKLVDATEKRCALESKIYQDLVCDLRDSHKILFELFGRVGELDALQGLAFAAHQHRLVKPEFIEERVELIGSRHLVVEKLTPLGKYKPNDVRMEKGKTMLLTGPNMAGKSTLMRQVAHLVILAQAGSYVPASSAKLPVFDKIFTRIGASDRLTEGLSTFMVEMKETAELVKFATPNSLVILDEVGRGTSTYDGVSLAQSLLEHLSQKIGPTVFFATHYFEMIKASQSLQGVSCFHMAVAKSDNDEVRFLYALREGPISQSFGLNVAKLAGLPTEVIERARFLLSELESRSQSILAAEPHPGLELQSQTTESESESEWDEPANRSQGKNRKTTHPKLKSDGMGQLPLFEFLATEDPKVALFNTLKASLDKTDINRMTPLESLQVLASLKDLISDLHGETSERNKRVEPADNRSVDS